MNRLPKKRGITQIGEDKSLILRQNVGNPPARTWLTPSQLGYLSEFGMLVLLRF